MTGDERPMELRYGVVHADGTPRRVVLDRAANVRDLGGFPTPDGVTRFGRVLRADQLGRLTERDVELLRGVVRVVRTVDLRGRDEVEALGPGRLVEAGVEHRHLPVRDRANDPAVFATRRGRTWAQNYLAQLEEHADRFLAAVDALADDGAGHGAAIVHCTAGKDRTGLTAMLVLGAVGVADELVVDDYAATARVPAEAKAASRDPRADEFWADFVRYADTADLQTPEQMEHTMTGVLTGVRERWGSIVGYLRAHGGAHLSDALRRRLL